jgi:hypothetical protein
MLVPEIGRAAALAMDLYAGFSTCGVAIICMVLLKMIGLKIFVVGRKAWLETWRLSWDLVWWRG